MTQIHATAVVHPKAEIADDVTIGAYSIIGEHVQIGRGTQVAPHVVIEGHTQIGEDNRIFQFSSLGAIPQDMKYRGEPTRLIIGDRNTIREGCTFNIGTVTGIGETRIGDDNWIMAYVHLAHDCVVGSHTIFANNTSLAGHVTIGDYVVLGGFSLVYQFCMVADHSMTAFSTGVHKDVPPYVMAAGYRAVPRGINSEGMRRHGFSAKQIANVRQAYKLLYRQGLSYEEAKQEILSHIPEQPELQVFQTFFENASSRGIIRGNKQDTE